MSDPTTQPYYLQTSVDRKINFLINNNSKITQQVLDQVYITAQVEAGIAKYRADADDMTEADIAKENHDSEKLGERMGKLGDPRPHPLCEAHAMVSGGHKEAAGLRLILAFHKVRIDDPINGCWLPKNTAAVSQMPTRLRKAVPHSRIHRYNYYQWLINQELTEDRTNTKEDLYRALTQVAFKLQTSQFDPKVMKPKGAK